MAADLFKDDLYFKKLVRLGSDLVSEDLQSVCLKGPERKQMEARFLQPLICAISLAYCRRLTDAGILPDLILGHSLGEITSLAAAGMVPPETGITIAVRRGQLMDEASEKNPGGMVAALFMPIDIVEQLLSELNQPARIVIANDNAQDQVLVSGDNEMLDRFCTVVRERKLGRTARVNVSGPWHSPYLCEGRADYEHWVAPITFSRPAMPIIMNATAKPETDPAVIKRLSTGQLTCPVYWRQSMDTLRQTGITTLIEIGPGRVLCGLARVNGFRGGASMYPANSLQGVERTIAALRST